VAERVIGVIPNARMKTGLMNSETWTLVVTDSRLLGARLTNDVAKRNVEEARAAAGASGSGFLGQWGAQIKAGFQIGKRYYTMTPAAVLAETPANWALLPGQVSSIHVERKSRSGGDDTADVDYLKITMHVGAAQGVYETNDMSVSQRDAQAMLTYLFGPTVVR
jgi:hypothetical protein